MRDINYDKYYLSQNKKKEPKEIFKFIANKSSAFLENLSKPVIGDIGCATGDFLFYLDSIYPDAKFTGMDYDADLIEVAKKEVPGPDYYVMDICNKETFGTNAKFDALFMIGVHSYFDEISTWASNFLSMLKPGGRGFVFGLFNDEPLDVLTKIRHADKSEQYYTFGNLFSKLTLEKEFMALNAKVKTYDFEIFIDVEKNLNDPLRSWTFKDHNGKRIIVNGAKMIQSFVLAEIITDK
jgi:SAM-dependent methyltransferase